MKFKLIVNSKVLPIDTSDPAGGIRTIKRKQSFERRS